MKNTQHVIDNLLFSRRAQFLEFSSFVSKAIKRKINKKVQSNEKVTEKSDQLLGK